MGARNAWIFGGIAVVALGGAGLWWGLRSGDPHDPPATTTQGTTAGRTASPTSPTRDPERSIPPPRRPAGPGDDAWNATTRDAVHAHLASALPPSVTIAEHDCEATTATCDVMLEAADLGPALERIMETASYPPSTHDIIVDPIEHVSPQQQRIHVQLNMTR